MDYYGDASPFYKTWLGMLRVVGTLASGRAGDSCPCRSAIGGQKKTININLINYRISCFIVILIPASTLVILENCS